ncbi:MAG: CARDB domain-containing protein [Candidatus Thermoplasmatota archaeon]
MTKKIVLLLMMLFFSANFFVFGEGRAEELPLPIWHIGDSWNYTFEGHEENSDISGNGTQVIIGISDILIEGLSYDVYIANFTGRFFMESQQYFGYPPTLVNMTLNATMNGTSYALRKNLNTIKSIDEFNGIMTVKETGANYSIYRYEEKTYYSISSDFSFPIFVGKNWKLELEVHEIIKTYVEGNIVESKDEKYTDYRNGTCEKTMMIDSYYTFLVNESSSAKKGYSLSYISQTVKNVVLVEKYSNGNTFKMRLTSYQLNLTANSPPIATITKPTTYSFYNDTDILFDCEGIDENVGALRYEWDFGDGSSSNEKETKHSYKKAGKYKVTLTLTDDFLLKDSDSIELDILLIPTPNIYIFSFEAIPDNATIGDNIELKVGIGNNGTENASNVSVEFWHTPLFYKKLTLLYSTKVSVDVNTQIDVSYIWNTTNAIEGKHLLKVWVGMLEASKELTLNPKPKPNLYIDNIGVEPEKVLPCENITVFAVIKNNGTADGFDEIKFYLDNETTYFAKKTIFVGIGKENKTTFIYTLPRSISLGEHIIKVNISNEEKFARFIVVKPNVYIDSIKVEPNITFLGSKVKITATLKNNGTANARNVSVIVYANDNELRKELVNFSDSINITVEFEPKEVGKYMIKVKCEGYEKETTLIVNKKLEPYISSINITFDKKEVEEGKTVKITVTIMNTGDAQANINVSIKDSVTGWTENTTIKIEPGKDASIIFSWKAKSPRKHTFTVTISGSEGKKSASAEFNVKPKKTTVSGFEFLAFFLAIIIVIIVLFKYK